MLPIDCISDFIFVEDSISKSDIILVPGGSQPQLMEKAAELYHMGMAPYILPSGGFNSAIPEHLTEWDFLRGIALDRGIQDDVILKEDRAKNTFENARFSLGVIQGKGLHIKTAILVCKGFHSRRALLTYQTIFPKGVRFCVAGVRDDSEIEKNNWFLQKEKVSIVMGEVMKIGSYFESEIHILADKPIP